MPGALKKPKFQNLVVSESMNSSFSLSDTGSFSQENFTFGPNGITQSPLSNGEVSSLRLDQLSGWFAIGRGNSSRVYRATHTPTGRQLAVKVLQAELEGSRESRHMLLNEIKVVFNACSDHLIAFHDAFLHDGAIYLALELMDCGSIEGLLRAASQTPEGVVPEGVNASLVLQILQGLTYLHRERTSVHRDLKPANVLLNSAGFVKLSDFGISKQLGSGTYAQAGTVVGTLAYMSPERVRGESYGFSSDVWSLGLIALEVAIGQYPYPGARNYFDLVQTIIEGPLPTEKPEVQQRLPPDLLQLVHGCLSKSAHERPDVITLTRYPFLVRHAAAPLDLRAYLLSMLPKLQQQGQPQASARAEAHSHAQGEAFPSHEEPPAEDMTCDQG